MVSQFHWHFIRWQKFGFADIGAINFPNFMFAAVQNFKFGFFVEFFLALGLAILSLVFEQYNHSISLLVI